MRENFQGESDYRIASEVVLVTGTDTGQSDAAIDLGEYPDQVDIICEVHNLATDNVFTATVWQNSTSDTTGMSTLSLDQTSATQAGQWKQRLQTQYDDTTLYPWLGPVEGRYLFHEYVVDGTNTTGATEIVLTALTLQSREYPTE